MSEIDFATLDPEEIYKLLTGIVVPRPIAWITTLSTTGVVNLAPFSCYTIVSTMPPLLGVNMGRKAGVRKDTARNAIDTGEFVVNIGNEDMIDPIHQSAVEHPPEVSEVALLKLAVLPCIQVKVPRLADVPLSLECRLHQVVPFGDTGAEFVVGEVLRVHAREGLLQNNRIDAAMLRPVCRLGGPNYATLGRIVVQPAVAQVAKSVLEGTPERP
jgi:flavin reductase (DIM6/NTAB) family NADH-FMN oxidoreductase RutF